MKRRKLLPGAVAGVVAAGGVGAAVGMSLPFSGDRNTVKRLLVFRDMIAVPVEQVNE